MLPEWICSMLKLSKTGSYSVPVVQRTLDILELLYRSDSPLKMNEISRQTGTPHSTTFRILRTLVDRGYLLHDLDGRFGVESAANLTIVPRFGQDPRTSSHGVERPKSGLSADQAIEIIFALLQNVRRANPAPTSSDSL
jgi:IclR helix-turn-helix domain